MPDRPQLTPALSAEDFSAYYWLKAELLAFCRQHGLPTAGAKLELSARIEHFLRSGEILRPQRRSSRSGRAVMPTIFTPETVIGEGWRCSQALRAFFEAQIGPRFHFNQVMRDFIKHGSGKTLADAISAWQEAQRKPQQKTEIAPQFEYMRHMREYFSSHPQATREAALRAWHAKKAQRKS